jgi:hypothetical protein
VCERHPNTGKCNQLLNHVFKTELLRRHPKLAAQLNVLLQEKYKKVLAARRHLDPRRPDFRKGGM